MSFKSIILLVISFSLLQSLVNCDIFRGQLFGADQDGNLYRMWNTSERGGNVIDPDSNQDIYAFNNMFPGPLITVQKGDQVNLLFNNKLQIAAVALYFHGISQRGNPWQGAAWINQCPLQPNMVGSYFYNFTADQAGTYWYHGDASLQFQKGLFGGLIVTDPEDPYKDKYTGEQLWFIHDFMNNPQQSYGLYQSALLAKQPESVDITDSDGSGSSKKSRKLKQASDTPAIDIGYINAMWGNGSADYPFPTFNVTQGSCFRLRLVAPTGATSGIRMYIAQHSLQVIAKNSVNVQPVDFAGVVLYSGERLDAIVCPSKNVGNYKIYMYSQDAYVAGLTETDKNTGAIVCKDPADTNCWTGVFSVTDQYFDVNVTTPGFIGTEDDLIQAGPMNNMAFYDSAESSIKLEMMAGSDNPNPDTIPAEASQTVNLYAGQLDTQAYYLWQDQIPFANPYTPLYFSMLKCGLRPNTHVLKFDLNSVVDIVINNQLDEYTPLHMHGNRFWQLAAGDLKEKETGRCSGSEFQVANKPDSLSKSQPFNASGCVAKSELNITNPLYSDTLVLAPQTYVYIRVRFDNPGAWLFQGYIQTHQEQGMSMVFAVGNPDTNWVQPTQKITMCGAWNCNKAQAPDNFDSSYDVGSLGLLDQLAPDASKLQLTSLLLVNAIIVAIYFLVRF